MEERQEKSR